MGRYNYYDDEEEQDLSPYQRGILRDYGIDAYKSNLPSTNPWATPPIVPSAQKLSPLIDEPYNPGGQFDYSFGSSAAPWMSAAPQKTPPPQRSTPAPRVNYMDMLSGMDTSPYDLTPQQSYQPLPMQQMMQTQPTAPAKLPTDLGFLGTRNDPWQNIFAPDPATGTQQRNDPWKKTFPTPLDFMEPEAQAPNWSFMQGDEKKERPYPLLDRFAELAWNKPRQEDYQGGKGNRIMAMLAGGMTGLTKGAGAGIAAAQQIRQAPYMHAMEDWKEQLAAGKDAATLERFQADIERKRDYGETLLDIKDRTQRQNYLMTKAKMEANGWRFIENRTTGGVQAFNMITKEQQDFGKVGASAEETARAAGMKETELEKARMPGREKIEGMRESSAAARQRAGFGNQASLQRNLFAHQDVMQGRGFANAADARRENVMYDLLKKTVGNYIDLDTKQGQNSLNEAIGRAQMQDAARYEKFFPGGHLDPAAVKASPNDWQVFQDEINYHLKKGSVIQR